MEPVFISYVHENKELIDRLYQELTSRGIEVWRDVQNLKPGGFWKEDIRKAIQDGAFFVACFSKEYNEHDETYMNEELTIAIEKLRQRHPNREWFIPIKLNKCELPDFDIGRGKTLEDLTYVKLYEDWDSGIQRIVNLIRPESSENTWDESRIGMEIDQKAAAEYAKGLASQKEIGLISHPVGRQQKIKKTLDLFSKAIKIQPDYVHALNARGGIYIFMKKYDDAIKDFTETIRLDPAYFVAYYNRGTVYKTIGKNKEAIEDYSNVIKLKPDIPKTYLSRGIAYGGIGDFSHAIEDCSKAIVLNPDEDHAYCYRGIIWLFLKNWSKAKSDLTVAQERGIDIITVFNTIHESVSVYEKRNRVKFPEDIAAMLVKQD